MISFLKIFHDTLHVLLKIKCKRKIRRRGKKKKGGKGSSKWDVTNNVIILPLQQTDTPSSSKRSAH